MNQKAAITKELNAKHTKILEGLLKLPENRECADCKNIAPRWASINLGIFICLQCSGIHRSLGVHISKVRSATLDTWLPEQVAYMQRMGNEKSNAYWEAELPLHYDRSRFENFIREKYVDRRWIPRDGKVKSSPTSEDELASPPSSTSGSSSSITDFLANQKLVIERPRVEKEASQRTELTSAADQSLTSMRNSSITDLATSPGNPEVHKNGFEDQTTKVDPAPGAKKDSQMTEHSELKDQSAAIAAAAAATTDAATATTTATTTAAAAATATTTAAAATATATTAAVPVVQPSKVDYATELFRMLCVDDSAESDSSPSSSTSAWVDFDTDEEETIQEKNAQRSSDNKVHPEPKIVDIRTSMVPQTKECPQEHQKDATSHNQVLLEEPNTASGRSYHGSTASLQGIHAKPVMTSQAPYLNGRLSTINQSPGTHLQMLNIPPAKFATNPAPHTISSLHRPVVQLNGLSTVPAKTPPAALPVSGYDYDFSSLTQGMFTK